MFPTSVHASSSSLTIQSPKTSAAHCSDSELPTYSESGKKKLLYSQSALSRLLNCGSHSRTLLLKKSKKTEWVPRLYPRYPSNVKLPRKQYRRQADPHKVVRINFTELRDGSCGGLSHLQTALQSGPWVRAVPWKEQKLRQKSRNGEDGTAKSHAKSALAT